MFQLYFIFTNHETLCAKSADFRMMKDYMDDLTKSLEAAKEPIVITSVIIILRKYFFFNFFPVRDLYLHIYNLYF